MLEWIYGHLMLNPGLLVASIIVGFIALVSQMALYAKAGQKPLAALVPVWNVIVFCKVVGRPAKHALFLIVPGLVMVAIVAIYWPVINGLFPIHGPAGTMLPGPSKLSDATLPFILLGVSAIPLIYFVIQMFAEVCDSFGKHKFIDKVLCVCFNGAYILFVLGISNTLYESGWWSRKRGKKYYMPDFKHKGKKFLVTPEKAVEKDGDWKQDKLRVKIVDKSDNSIYDGSDPGDGAEVVIEGTANFQKVVERKVMAFNEALESGKSAEEIKAEAESTLTNKPEPKKEKEAPEQKAAASTESKSAPKKKPKDESDESSSDGSGSLADTAKKFSKKESDGKPKASSGKTWKEEMLEKYKKKK